MAEGARTTFDLGVLEEGAGALKSHGGNVDSYRAELASQIDGAISNFDGGIGADEVAQVKAKANELIDQHIQDLKTHGSSLQHVSGDTQATMGQVRRGLAPS